MAWSNFRWTQELDRKREKSKFLRDNHVGAKVGEAVGGAGAGVVSVVGIYAGAAYAYSAVTAAVLAGAPAEVAAGAAAGGGAVAGGATAAQVAKAAAATGAATAVQAGRNHLIKLGSGALKDTVFAAVDVGRHGGAYAGATVHAGVRWIFGVGSEEVG
jgi:hypothetical protein